MRSRVALGSSEAHRALLEGDDAVLNVRRVGEDGGGHDGCEMVGQVVAAVEAAVLGAVAPALLVLRAARTVLNCAARARGDYVVTLHHGCMNVI